MIKAVIFDMFETLVTHYNCTLYFGTQMAEDAGIPVDSFQEVWHSTEDARTIGEMTLEDALEVVFRENGCMSDELLNRILDKRIAIKRECFHCLDPMIIPMLDELKKRDIRIGLISNCFSEEAHIIRGSELFPYFDALYLSYEQGIKKPDEEIFNRCVKSLSVNTEECLYVGDGGSFELETASRLGMKAVQAIWYTMRLENNLTYVKNGFVQVQTPMEILNYI